MKVKTLLRPLARMYFSKHTTIAREERTRFSVVFGPPPLNLTSMDFAPSKLFACERNAIFVTYGWLLVIACAINGAGQLVILHRPMLQFGFER